VPAIVSACREDEIAWWLDQVPQPYSEADARTYVAMSRRGWKDGTLAGFAVTDAETSEVIGSIGVHFFEPEQGLAGIERLQLRADRRNVASQRVAEAAGFRREGVLRSAHFNARQGRRVDFVMYSLLAGELRE